ncbi:MAG: hypothetical protein Q8N47_22425 [Bryobacterales bacterium]|nr:hypothetical protein [Bryobacterales bacterium]
MKTGKGSLKSYGVAGLGSSFRIPRVPIEWLDGQSWRLPSGQALAEFALQAGFLAPLLMKAVVFGGVPPKSADKGMKGAVATRETR